MSRIDERALDDLDLYLESSVALSALKKRILANMLRKMAQGTYDPKKAPLIWESWVEAGAMRYAADFARPEDWTRLFPAPLRHELARRISDHEYGRMVRGEHSYVFRNPLSSESVVGFAWGALAGGLLTWAITKYAASKKTTPDEHKALNAELDTIQAFAPVPTQTAAPQPGGGPGVTPQPTHILWVAYSGAADQQLADSDVVWKAARWGQRAEVLAARDASWADLFPVYLNCVRDVNAAPLTRGRARQDCVAS